MEFRLPCVAVRVAVAEVVHVHAVPLQAAGALLHPRKEAPPVRPLRPIPVQPPREGCAVYIQPITSQNAKKRVGK